MKGLVENSSIFAIPLDAMAMQWQYNGNEKALPMEPNWVGNQRRCYRVWDKRAGGRLSLHPLPAPPLWDGEKQVLSSI